MAADNNNDDDNDDADDDKEDKHILFCVWLWLVLWLV